MVHTKILPNKEFHLSVQANADYNEERCRGFVCDLTRDPLSATIPRGVHMASLFFVLSAVAPEKMGQVLKNVFDVGY